MRYKTRVIPRRSCVQTRSRVLVPWLALENWTFGRFGLYFAGPTVEGRTMRILLAVDPPEVSDAPVLEVAKRPWPAGTTIDVLSVLEPSHVWDVPTLVEGLKEAASDTAEGVAEQLREAGLDAVARVQCGDPKAVIVDRAREMGADLVIVGSRGTKGLARFLLGSVAAAVARHAPCPVEIARPAARGGAQHAAPKVLLATDGSECSRLAAESIAGRPWAEGAVVRVLSVAEVAPPLFRMPHFSGEALEKLRAAALQHAERAKTEALGILTAAGLKASGIVIAPGAVPKEAILHSAEEWGADLIVCGSHGRRGVNRFLLGSVSEALAAHAKCSVAIVRRAAA